MILTAWGAMKSASCSAARDVKLLLDTHILLWAANEPDMLPAEAHELIADEDSQLFFSPASIWEIVIKTGLGRADFDVDPHLLRRGLIDNGYSELPITSEHALAVSALPSLHKDPFDRILIAQATAEGFGLLTADEAMTDYPGPIRYVGSS